MKAEAAPGRTRGVAPNRSILRALASTRRVMLLAMLLLLALVASLLFGGRASAGSGDHFAQNFQSLAADKPWEDGTVHGKLHSVFDGYGSVGVVRDGGKVLSLSPKTSTSPDETHAALVTSVPSFDGFDLTARMKTVEQLRQNNPNPWEVGWIVWNYTDNTHFYYLTLKPNGWELGKADPAYPGAQRFLATGSDRTFPVGEWNTVRIRQVGNTMTVSANGTKLTTFTDSESPYRHGSVGFYTEDARVNFDNVVVKAP